MDEKDQRLLGLLKRDSRRPIVALARELGLSRTATQDRLLKLQDSGAIARFTIVEGSGRSLESAYLTVTLDRGTRCTQIAPRIKAIPAVEAIHSVTGNVDMIVRLVSEHIGGIETARAEIAGLSGVSQVSTHVVLERFIG